ncbi:unnamed protein product [Pedinophyceae sp. YPF-701]|nr:unnamed protein product [Pedinophyceae sp. YPF-701]
MPHRSSKRPRTGAHGGTLDYDAKPGVSLHGASSGAASGQKRRQSFSCHGTPCTCRSLVCTVDEKPRECGKWPWWELHRRTAALAAFSFGAQRGAALDTDGRPRPPVVLVESMAVASFDSKEARDALSSVAAWASFNARCSKSICLTGHYEKRTVLDCMYSFVRHRAYCGPAIPPEDAPPEELQRFDAKLPQRDWRTLQRLCEPIVRAMRPAVRKYAEVTGVRREHTSLRHAWLLVHDEGGHTPWEGDDAAIVADVCLAGPPALAARSTQAPPGSHDVVFAFAPGRDGSATCLAESDADEQPPLRTAPGDDAQVRWVQTMTRAWQGDVGALARHDEDGDAVQPAGDASTWQVSVPVGMGVLYRPGGVRDLRADAPAGPGGRVVLRLFYGDAGPVDERVTYTVEEAEDAKVEVRGGVVSGAENVADDFLEFIP